MFSLINDHCGYNDSRNLSSGFQAVGQVAMYTLVAIQVFTAEEGRMPYITLCTPENSILTDVIGVLRKSASFIATF